MKFFIIIIGLSFFHYSSAQNSTRDSLVQILINDQSTPGNDPGVQLMQTGNFSDANKFFSAEIGKDESDREAYFRRGVANWALSDTLSACRDWSAVLALGDTEMFNLLDSKCHGAMIIDEDTIPPAQVRKLWARNKKVDPSAYENARTVTEVMPAFPGGEQKLFDYLLKNKKQIPGGKRGTVYVNFLISPEGKILFPYVARGIDKACDKEALRLIRSMPSWNPGKDKGKATYVRSSLPVRF